MEPGLERGERGTDEGVAWVSPLAEGRDRQAIRRRRWQVLGRMDRQVGSTIEHRSLDLLDEHPLAADHVERHVQANVAGRLDGDQFDRSTGGCGDRRGNGAGLAERLT